MIYPTRKEVEDHWRKGMLKLQGVLSRNSEFKYAGTTYEITLRPNGTFSISTRTSGEVIWDGYNANYYGFCKSRIVKDFVNYMEN